jgi:ubiquinone/menaquinone biosynthesis C-methylase UbiE
MNHRLYDTVTAIAERAILGQIRRRLLNPLGGHIVEIGAGSGASFAYYTAHAAVRAFEPDASMLAGARKRAARSRARIELVQADDSAMDELPAQSVDHVVFSLVLCSVEDPLRALARARRILKPGGTLVLMEHVRGHGTPARWQDWLTPAWRCVAGGCRLNRSLEPMLRTAGFGGVRLQSRSLPFPLLRLVFTAPELPPSRVP